MRKKTLWEKCNGNDHIITLTTHTWRIVEAQDILATRKLVDSLEEQNILEELIELNKPPLSENLLGMHYLLYTPFRYPPLKHGSRFGTQLEPSLWYGSFELNTAMAEAAYYRFNFLRASQAKFGNVITNLTAFSAKIKTDHGVNLATRPFSEFTQLISAPDSYQESQKLGSTMRSKEIEAFYYQSARDPGKGMNVALFTPRAFFHKNPSGTSFQSWQCIVNEAVAEFVRSSSINVETRSFPMDLFLINGALPFPAS